MAAAAMQGEATPQPLALRGPTRTVDLPLWEGPERKTDCTILGRMPAAGVRTTYLGLTNDKRISKEHAILICDAPTGRWHVENLKPNPIFIQRGFATNATAEPERLRAGGQPTELAVGDAICFAVVDGAHRIVAVPRLSQHQPRSSAPKRAAAALGSECSNPPAAKRARSPVPSNGQALDAGEQPHPASPSGDRTPIMSLAADVVGAKGAGPTASVGLSPVPQAAFAHCVITFVERGMREKQLQVFKKQVQHGGGRWSSNRLAVDDEGSACTTHIVANSWNRVAEAIGESLIGPTGLPVANADWMVQAIKDSKSGRQISNVVGKYRLHPPETGESCPGGGDIALEATSLVDVRQVEHSQDSQRSSQSADGTATEEGRAAFAAADIGRSADTDKVPLLIKLFEELQDLTEVDESKNNHWRVRNYQKMVNCLKKYHERGWPPLVRSSDFMHMIDDIKEDRMPGCPLFVVKDCTETLKKAEEALRTGTMARIEAFRQDPRMNALRSLAQVWGVGLKQASDLYAAGFTTLQSLRTPEGQQRLNRVQKLGLRYHEDLALRIPRDEITAMVSLIKRTAEELVGSDKAPGLRVEGVGSYRRNKSTSGDIDVLLSHTDGITHVKLLELLVESLTASGFLREKLTDTTASSKKSAEDEKSKNKHTRTRQPNGGKYMGIALFDPAAHGTPEGTTLSTLRPRHRHIDLFTCPDDQWACALLTHTGSDVHNRSMRHWCAQMGLALSEKALAPAQREERGCYRDNKYVNNKIFVGEHLPMKTERDIYDHLGLLYKEPHERDGKVEHKKLCDWDCRFVSYWMQCAVMLPQYMDAFKGNGIDGAALESITAADLHELGVSESHTLHMLLERDRAAAHDLNSWYRRFRRV